MGRDGQPSVLFRVSFFACALPAVPQFIELVVVVFVEPFVIPSEQARVGSVKRKEVFQIRERGVRRYGEGNVVRGRGGRERCFSDGIRVHLIKVSNCASCIHYVFFQFPCVFLLG